MFFVTHFSLGDWLAALAFFACLGYILRLKWRVWRAERKAQGRG